jgi:hypothetical protein
VERQLVFLNCPAYLDNDGTIRCGLPAEVETRYTMRSTDGPLESAKIRCPRGHWFNGPIASLTLDSTDRPGPGTARASSRAGCDGLQGTDDGHGSGTGTAGRNVPAEPEREARHPNGAPAFYLGRPAALWITAMHPRRRRAAAHYPMETAVSGGTPTRDSGVLHRRVGRPATRRHDPARKGTLQMPPVPSTISSGIAPVDADPQPDQRRRSAVAT